MQSKIDALLEGSSRSERERLEALLHSRVAHTEVAETFGVSEAAVRRWRQQTNVRQTAPKILIWDIESSPILGYTWGLWEQNVIHVKQDWRLLAVSWTWYGSGEYHARQLCDFKGYKRGDLDDRELALFARELLNEADYSVAHNGNAFDVKKVNAKLAEHGIAPPSPHTQIDTLAVARRNMKMSSNRLDYLGEMFGVGRKLKHSGFELWLRCMAGERAAWEEMREYAIQDVVLLEQVFGKLLPWTKGLNHNLFTRGPVCATCGSPNLTQEGSFKTATTRKAAWLCSDCKSWNREQRIRGIK